MADLCLPRATESRKQNSLISEDKAPVAPPRHGISVVHDLPNYAFGPTRPRGHVVDERMYISGLAPAVRISDIPDVPDDLKARMLAAAEQRAAHRLGEANSGSVPEASRTADLSPTTLHDAAVAAPEIANARRECPAAGPVFDAAEIAAARALMDCLREHRLVLIDAAGLHLGHHIVVHQDLCSKLAVIGLITVTRLRGRLIVRRRP
ncbi:hypothetical protein [Aurantimonas coralicida]|uniref:hypothetical protein n=1 Tax=Aurantimonas coralicida TaxID=182270 RepID=UPI001E601023|nr:hypothetical protein [Aurantimonas coralicida]MCD1645615.1 hypothetical protein [Aurantimonas coralicida]